MAGNSNFVSFELLTHNALKLGVLTFGDKQTCNALSKDLITAFEDQMRAISELVKKESINFLILYGGPKAFSSGSNLKERRTMEDIEVMDFVDRLNSLYDQIDQLPIITMAAIQGPALAGGLELALTCDVRVASESAQLGLSETSIGIIPGAGGTYRLRRIMSEAQVKVSVLFAKRYSALEAFQHGLITQMYPDANFIDSVIEGVKEQCEAISPYAMIQAKRLTQNYRAHYEKNFHLIERSFYLNTLYSEDRREGLKAFEEQRPPQFTGVSTWISES